jgi:hypothetical protein
MKTDVTDNITDMMIKAGAASLPMHFVDKETTAINIYRAMVEAEREQNIIDQLEAMHALMVGNHAWSGTKYPDIVLRAIEYIDKLRKKTT